MRDSFFPWKDFFLPLKVTDRFTLFVSCSGVWVALVPSQLSERTPAEGKDRNGRNPSGARQGKAGQGSLSEYSLTVQPNSTAFWYIRVRVR